MLNFPVAFTNPSSVELVGLRQFAYLYVLGFPPQDLAVGLVYCHITSLGAC